MYKSKVVRAAAVPAAGGEAAAAQAAAAPAAQSPHGGIDRKNSRSAVEPDLADKILDTPKTGVMKVDLDPLDIEDKDLDALLENRKRNFVTYYGGAPKDAASTKIRVNGKIRPTDSRIPHPPEMTGMKKTTLIKKEDQQLWEVFEL